MTDEPSLPRFLVRQGTRGFMVWDRDRKGPAMFDGYLAIGLSEWQANQIKEQLRDIMVSRLSSPQSRSGSG
jgi:hypothetical protein